MASKFSIATRYFNGNLVSAVTYDEDGSLSKCNHGFAATFWKHDENGRKTTQSYYGPDLHLVRDARGITTIRWAYPPESSYQSFDYINSEALHFEEDRGPSVLRRRRGRAEPSHDDNAILREEFDKESRRIRQVHLSAMGSLQRDVNGVAMVHWTYSGAGNIVEQRHFGLEESLTNDLSGIAVIRWRYDSKGRKVERRFFDSANVLIEDLKTGIARTQWVYDDAGRSLEESYYDINGRLKEERVSGIATIRWRYWREDDPISWYPYKEYGEEAYYDTGGRIRERRDVGIASVRWVNKGFREFWHDDKWTRILEWTFHGENGALKAVPSEKYLVPIAIEQWVLHAGNSVDRRYFLNDQGAKVLQD